MRIPSLHKKLNMTSDRGLSRVLVSRKDADVVDWSCITRIKNDNNIDFDVLLAGEIPPNPSELLGSSRMEHIVGCLREKYDFIFLDS